MGGHHHTRWNASGLYPLSHLPCPLSLLVWYLLIVQTGKISLPQPFRQWDYRCGPPDLALGLLFYLLYMTEAKEWPKAPPPSVFNSSLNQLLRGMAVTMIVQEVFCRYSCRVPCRGLCPPVM